MDPNRSVSADCYTTLGSAFGFCRPDVTESHVPSPIVFSYYRGSGGAILKLLAFLLSPQLRWVALNVEAWHPSLLATMISALYITVPVTHDIGIHGVAERGKSLLRWCPLWLRGRICNISDATVAGKFLAVLSSWPHLNSLRCRFKFAQ